jgi:hypothetical protein
MDDCEACEALGALVCETCTALIYAALDEGRDAWVAERLAAR